MTGLADVASPRDVSQRPAVTPKEAIEATRAREQAVSRLLMAFVISGLVFMVFPGTFLGVWNLLQISGRESVATILAGVAAGTRACPSIRMGGKLYPGDRILFDSQDARRSESDVRNGVGLLGDVDGRRGLALDWQCLRLGMARALLPVSAVLEVAAFLIFFRAVSQHRPARFRQHSNGALDLGRDQRQHGILVGACLRTLRVASTFRLRGATPAFPHVLDQRYLTLMAWGFLVPFVWGFSAKWMAVFLGLKPIRPRWLLAAVVGKCFGRCVDDCRVLAGSVRGFFSERCCARLRHCECSNPPGKKPKIRGVHSSFPCFVRMAYGVAADRRCPRSGGSEVGFFGRDLGSVAPRIDGRVYRRNDPERGTANPSGICRDAVAMEHQTHVRGPGACYAGLHAARFLRDHRLSGICGVGMVGAADLRALRACRADDLRDQYSGHIYSWSPATRKSSRWSLRCQ